MEAWLRGLQGDQQQGEEEGMGGAGESAGAGPGAGGEGSRGQGAVGGLLEAEGGSTTSGGCCQSGGRGMGLGWLWRCCFRGTGTV